MITHDYKCFFLFGFSKKLKNKTFSIESVFCKHPIRIEKKIKDLNLLHVSISNSYKRYQELTEDWLFRLHYSFFNRYFHFCHYTTFFGF